MPSPYSNHPLPSTISTKSTPAHVIRHSLHHSNFLITKLVSSCLSSHKRSYALQVFEQMPHPNIFLWNAFIRGLVDLHAHLDALLFYFRMLDSGFLPNNFTFPFVLKACSKLLALKQGKTVHAQILKLGFSLDVYTQTALLDFYGSCGEIFAVRYLFDRMPERVVCGNAVVAGQIRCGLVDFAEEVFEVMPVRNVSSWTTMIGGFVHSGKSVEALALLRDGSRTSNLGGCT